MGLRTLLIAILGLALSSWSGVAVGRANFAQEPGASLGTFYCPMHPDITSTTQASCSRCGMKLVPGDPLDAREYLVVAPPRRRRSG